MMTTVRAYVDDDGHLMVDCGERGDGYARRATAAERRESFECPQAEGWILTDIADRTARRIGAREAQR